MSEHPVVLRPVEDMQGMLPTVRVLVFSLLEERLPGCTAELDVYREWSGGWRVRAHVSGRVTGVLDFALLHTPQGGILAMPIPLPQRWRQQGVVASDGSCWTMDSTGDILACA